MPKIYMNGITREMTDEEYSDYLNEQAEWMEREQTRELTITEKLEAQITYTALMTGTLLGV